MANMNERFKKDLVASLDRVQSIYSAMNKVAAPWGDDFCMKFTTFNDKIFTGFIGATYDGFTLPVGKKVHPYFCFKLSRYKDGEYYTGYLYPLSMTHAYNYYLLPENDPDIPAYGLVLVNVYDGSLAYHFFNDINEAARIYSIFAC